MYPIMILSKLFLLYNNKFFSFALIIVHSHYMLSRKAEGLDPVKP